MGGNCQGPVTDPGKMQTGKNLSIYQYSKYEIRSSGSIK